MLVGHEPDFSNLAGVLIGGRAESVHFRKANTHGRNSPGVEAWGLVRSNFFFPSKCL